MHFVDFNENALTLTAMTSFLKILVCMTSNTVFMLIERMIQLPQENSIPGIVCILLERKLLPVIIFFESN